MATDDWRHEWALRNGWGGTREGSGRKKDMSDRCPCGLMTKHRAERRGHRCTKPKKNKQTKGAQKTK